MTKSQRFMELKGAGLGLSLGPGGCQAGRNSTASHQWHGTELSKKGEIDSPVIWVLMTTKGFLIPDFRLCVLLPIVALCLLCVSEAWKKA